MPQHLQSSPATGSNDALPRVAAHLGEVYAEHQDVKKSTYTPDDFQNTLPLFSLNNTQDRSKVVSRHPSYLHKDFQSVAAAEEHPARIVPRLCRFEQMLGSFANWTVGCRSANDCSSQRCQYR